MDKNDLKLKKALLKWGVTEEEAETFINELKEDVGDVEAETDVEQPLEKGDGEVEQVEEVGETEEVEPAPVDAEPTEPEQPVEEPTEPVEQPVEEVGEVAEEPQVEPVEEPVEQPQEQPVDPNEINPAEIAPEQEPSIDTVGLQHKNEELQKALDGVTARLSALEDSLKQAGVLVDERATVEVGIDENKAPANNPIDNPMEDVLSQINHRSY